MTSNDDSIGGHRDQPLAAAHGGGPMTPDQPELDFSATEEEIVFDDEECELCSGDPPEQGERQFRRELFEWVKRRAFYHGIDVDAVRSALDELASVLGFAAHSYQEQDHIDVVAWLQDYLEGRNLNEEQSGVALVAVMYDEFSLEYALQEALLSKAIEMQGGWDEWAKKVWRGQETIGRLELRKAEREAVEWLRTNYPDQTRLVEQETNRQFDAEIEREDR